MRPSEAPQIENARKRASRQDNRKFLLLSKRVVFRRFDLRIIRVDSLGIGFRIRRRVRYRGRLFRRLFLGNGWLFGRGHVG
jgi:hypothetical protein